MESEALALNVIGHNYGRMGDYGNAMTYMEQALVIESERGEDSIRTYSAMGDVLAAQEGREKEVILMFQKCVGLFGEGDASEAFIRVFFKLGDAYTTIGAWDDAIAYLEKVLSITESIEDERFGNKMKATAKEDLGKVYLEKFYTDEIGIPERNDELIRKALFWSEAALKDCSSVVKLDPTICLDLAQERYFLGDSEEAHAALKMHLDETVQLGPSHCQKCRQICAKDAIVEKYSVCKVARYCNQASGP